MANRDIFMTILASLSNPSDANRPLKKTKHGYSRFTRTKQNLPRLQQITSSSRVKERIVSRALIELMNDSPTRIVYASVD